MRKRLSFLIALAISLSIGTTSFAAAANVQNITNNTTTVQKNNGPVYLSLDDALNKIEDNNTEIKLMGEKLKCIDKQYYLEHEIAVLVDFHDPMTDKLQGHLQELIVPLKTEQSSNDQKNAIDERLNSIKFDIERQYMNVLTCREQIDNINKTIANIDEQIRQLQAKIDVGQKTSDALDPLNVQKSQLASQIDSITSDMEQSEFLIKQYLNIDLDVGLSLAPAKKEFVKFDDTNIESKINEAVQKDYSISKVKNNISIAKQEQDIYFKYQRNEVSGEVSAQKRVATLETELVNTNTKLNESLWNSYNALKGQEQNVQTQILSEESAKVAYNKTKSNYDNGMIDKVALDSAALALDKQRNLTQRAVNEYVVTQQQFNYMLTGHASTEISTKSIGVSGIEY